MHNYALHMINIWSNANFGWIKYEKHLKCIRITYILNLWMGILFIITIQIDLLIHGYWKFKTNNCYTKLMRSIRSVESSLCKWSFRHFVVKMYQLISIIQNISEIWFDFEFRQHFLKKYVFLAILVNVRCRVLQFCINIIHTIQIGHEFRHNSIYQQLSWAKWSWE